MVRSVVLELEVITVDGDVAYLGTDVSIILTIKTLRCDISIIIDV